MNNDNELRKIGIIPKEKIEVTDKIKIAKYVSDKLSDNVEALSSSYNYNELYIRIYNCEMYYADIDPKFKGVFYYYKYNSIYIDKNATDIERYLIHEILHYLQKFNKVGKETDRAGLCNFMEFKILGLGINEAIVQYITAKAMGNKIKRIENQFVSIATNSENYYKYLTSLANQILFLLGEEQAIQSTVSSNEKFEDDLYNTFQDDTNKILKGFDAILDENNKQDRDEAKIINIYMETQELIYKTYFKNMSKMITEKEDVNDQVQKLENYETIMGKLRNPEYQLQSANYGLQDAKNINEFITNEDFEKFRKIMRDEFFLRYLDIEKRKEQTALSVINRNKIYELFRKIREFIQRKLGQLGGN